jgi:hypothetical protein
MGKLRELVKFRNELVEKLDQLDLNEDIENKIRSLSILSFENSESTYLSNISDAITSYQSLQTEAQTVKNKLKEFLKEINKELYSYARTEYTSDFYQKNFVEEGIKKHLTLNVDLTDKIVSRITLYCDWHYPGLLIMPRSKDYIDLMVGCDPLYLTAYSTPILWDLSPGMEKVVHDGLVDALDSFESWEIYNLKEMIAKYPLVYQRRVRLYSIKDRDFRILPREQFGFVLCWDTFDYLTYDIIKQYVQEVFKMLRPGGVFMFSYTNCELTESADKVDSWNASCCFSSWLSELFLEIGYELITFYDERIDGERPSYISWAEVRKPGELKTIKYHQSMGEIRDINE